MAPFVDLTGQTFGRLSVLARWPTRPAVHATLFLCRCVCGRTCIARSQRLKSGATASCGCYQLAARFGRRGNLRHGYYGTPTYRSWVQAKSRCSNPKVQMFAYYGGRGIIMCARWRDSFDAFLADMGPRPSLAHSLDRIDNDGHYEPGNCRWATRSEQQRNKRRAGA